MSVPRVTVSVLCFTNLVGAKSCIASVLKSTIPFKLMLTANGNHDAGRYFRELSQEFTNISNFEYSTNLGFQIPNKIAFAHCETPFFVTLNDDAIIPPDGLEKMLHIFDHDLDMAIVGQENACCSLRDDFMGFKGERYEYAEMACAMMRTAFFREHGLFSDYIEHSGTEDSDASLRMRELGYKIACAKFSIKHEVGATRKNVPGLSVFFRKNLAACQERWADYLKSKDRKFPHER